MGLSKISLFHSSLLIYKNTTYFWIFSVLPLFWIHFSSNSFLVEPLGFFMYSMLSSANNDSFTFSLPILMSFISSSCLIAVARTSSTMLNGWWKVNIPVLLLIVRKAGFEFWIWYWLWVCHIWPLLYWNMFPLFSLCWVFFLS